VCEFKKLRLKGFSCQQCGQMSEGRETSFYSPHRECAHWGVRDLDMSFRSDRRSFLKGKTIRKGKIVRKGPPKRKLGVDITKMLDDLKESENSEFKGYGEKHNWTHKSCLCELSYAKSLILPPQHRFDAL
jgi:hypothetical protein